MAGSSASLTYKLFGVDVNASKAIRGVGDEAGRTDEKLRALGIGVAKWGGIAAGASIAAVGLSGALGVGLAGALAVGAAAIAAQVPRVRNAFVELGKGVKDQLIGLSKPVQDALIGLVNHTLVLFNQLQPTFKALFKAIAPVVTALGTGLVDSLAVLIRALPALLKVVQPLVDVFTAALVPIMGALVQTLKNILGPTAQNSKAFKDLLTVITTLLPILGTLLGIIIRIGAFLIEHFKPVLTPLVAVILALVIGVKAWTVATKAAAIAQAALNVVMALNPIGAVILSLALLVGAVVLIATKTRWFQNIWNASWGLIKRIAMDVWDWIKGHWPLLLGILTGPIGAAAIAIIRNWGQIKATAIAAFTAVVEWFKGLPGRIVSAIGNLRGLLVQVGKDVILGFWDGLKSVWKSVTGWISGLGGWIKAHKGPMSLDRDLLFDAGHAIMTGFWRGLKAGGLKAFGFVKSVAGNVWAAVTAGGIGAKGGSIVDLAQSMITSAFGGGQWPAFFNLEMREAGFNPFARNPSSGAYGIPQALPPGKLPPAAFSRDPMTAAFAQLLWMIDYIRGRYGNPAGAWAHEQAFNWYGSGGVFTRPTIIGVGERGPEAVIPLGRGGINEDRLAGKIAAALADELRANPLVVSAADVQQSLLTRKRRNGGINLGLT